MITQERVPMTAMVSNTGASFLYSCNYNYIARRVREQGEAPVPGVSAIAGGNYGRIGAVTTQDEVAALIVRVAGTACALPVGAVVETMRPLTVIPVDDTAAFVRGIAIIRGIPTPVVDLGPVRDASGARLRFVTVRVGGGVVALAVDEVVALSRFPTVAFARCPSLLTRLDPGVAQSIADEDRALHTVLETARLVEGAAADGDGPLAGASGQNERRSPPATTGGQDSGEGAR